MRQPRLRHANLQTERGVSSGRSENRVIGNLQETRKTWCLGVHSIAPQDNMRGAGTLAVGSEPKASISSTK
jgi:hypothetical protein